MIYENDVLEIPQAIKDMSVAELEKAETEFLIQFKEAKRDNYSFSKPGKLERLKKAGIILG